VVLAALDPDELNELKLELKLKLKLDLKLSMTSSNSV